jgi:hypothetical protein
MKTDSKKHACYRAEWWTWSHLLNVRHTEAHPKFYAEIKIQLDAHMIDSNGKVREWLKVSDRYAITRRDAWNFIESRYRAGDPEYNFDLILNLYPLQEDPVVVVEMVCADLWYVWLENFLSHSLPDWREVDDLSKMQIPAILEPIVVPFIDLSWFREQVQVCV